MYCRDMAMGDSHLFVIQELLKFNKVHTTAKDKVNREYHINLTFTIFRNSLMHLIRYAAFLEDPSPSFLLLKSLVVKAPSYPGLINLCLSHW